MAGLQTMINDIRRWVINDVPLGNPFCFSFNDVIDEYNCLNYQEQIIKIFNLLITHSRPKVYRGITRKIIVILAIYLSDPLGNHMEFIDYVDERKSYVYNTIPLLYCTLGPILCTSRHTGNNTKKANHLTVV